MQERNELDWKDVVDTYFEKCIAITLLFTVFVFIVFPNVETAVIRSSEKIMETFEILPDIPEEIKPPEEVAKPIVNIEIVDEPTDDPDVKEVETIGPNVDIDIPPIAPPPQQQNITGSTERFVPYDDPPVIMTGPRPVYPEHLRRTNISGQVVLDVEVFADGTIGAIEVVKSLMSGPGGFDEVAVEAVRQWKMQPAKSGGNSVACWMKQIFNFTK